MTLTYVAPVVAYVLLGYAAIIFFGLLWLLLAAPREEIARNFDSAVSWMLQPLQDLRDEAGWSLAAALVASTMTLVLLHRSGRFTSATHVTLAWLTGLCVAVAVVVAMH